ncbi:MAG TPA: hypothetical protein VIT22_14130 [Pseudoxanthomonas sp.]
MRAALLGIAWLAALGWMILAAVDLALPARIAVCVCAATAGLATIQSVFLLRGSRAVRALQWNDKGQINAVLGGRKDEYPVTVRPGSFRLGRHGLLLWLETGHGSLAVFIDASKQEPRAFRSLCRLLNRPRLRFPDESARPS